MAAGWQAGLAAGEGEAYQSLPTFSVKEEPDHKQTWPGQEELL